MTIIIVLRDLMTYKQTIPLFAVFFLLVSPALIFIPNIPVNQMTLFQVQVACDRLESELRTKYGTLLQDNMLLYAKVYLANFFLQQLSSDPGISSYSNVVFGSNTVTTGSKNIIIGSNGTIVGNFNYVFSQNFNSNAVEGQSINNSLVLDEWLIRLAEMYNIPFGSPTAVTRLAWSTLSFCPLYNSIAAALVPSHFFHYIK